MHEVLRGLSNCVKRVELTMTTISEKCPPKKKFKPGQFTNPVLRPSQNFIEKLDFQLSHDLIKAKNVGLDKFTTESRQQFKNFIESTVEKVIKKSGKFFEIIKLTSIKDLIAGDMNDLAIWGHRVANDGYLIYNNLAKQFTMILNSIETKLVKELNYERRRNLSNAIKNMIKVVEDSRSAVPKLRFSKMNLDDSTKPSQAFVDNLEQFKMAAHYYNQKNVLIKFTIKSRTQFTNFFESQIKKVLEVAEDFFDLVKLPTIKELIKNDVIQLRICVQRVVNCNYSSYSQFRSLFNNLMIKISKKLANCDSKESERLRNIVTKLRRVLIANGCPILVKHLRNE